MPRLKRVKMETDGNGPKGNTTTLVPRIIPGKYWCFTWNNYPEDGMETLETKFKCIEHLKYIIGKEVGESGTPHLQGYIEAPMKIRPSEKFGIKEIHWEKRKAETTEPARDYCLKDNDYVTNWNIPNDPLAGKEMHAFQKDVLKILLEEPDDRTVHWFWEADGCRGKTVLCKHICLKYKDNVILVDGKAADAKYMIAQRSEYPRIVLMNICRDRENYVSYEGIEAIKDGIFCSPKYESKMVLGNPPHFIIFANFPPDEKRMSADRWNVHHIE